MGDNNDNKAGAGMSEGMEIKGREGTGMSELRSLDEEGMNELVASLGQKAFRAKQIYEWIHKKQARSIDDMTNISKDLRQKLKEVAYVGAPEIIRRQVSKDKSTMKYLFKFGDGALVESVWLKYKHGNSVCISSQVGCRMGCTFCASTLSGLERSLTPGEMLSQIYEIEADTGERVSNIIVMGMGEPLDNFQTLTKFVRMVSNDKGICIGQRNITVSTCGLVDRIKELAKYKFQITLAISLHAPNDEIRRRTMPIANKYSMDEIFEVCRYYFKETGRRVTFEYSMISGVNDGPEHAKELAKRCEKIGKGIHINLIPLNEVSEREYKRPDMRRIHAFKEALESYGINVTIRREMGSDIDAACGQLRKNEM